jgi:FAD synthetase
LAASSCADFGSPSALSISFNGGKDCLVLLILYLAALGSTPAPSDPPPRELEGVYIESAHPFVQVETFVRAACATYSLALARYPPGMKAGFAAYLRARPRVRAVLVGTRRSDPHGASLSHFDETDHGWPSFMRVHPVIDWHYVDIWTVRAFQERRGI